MARIYIRHYKRNPKYWEVVGYGKNVQVNTKAEANKLANARRKMKDARKARVRRARR